MNKEKIKNEMKKFVDSNNFKYLIYCLIAIFLLSFVFRAGIFVGYRKASFNNNWGNNYERNFGPIHKAPPFIKDNFGDLTNAHGAIGKIIKIEFPNIVVLDKDQTEKIIIINDDTSILERKEKVSKENLALDQFIVLIGNPNNTGQIEAKLIRIIPAPMQTVNINKSEFNSKNI